MSELVIIENNTPLTTTKIIADETGFLHRSIKNIVNKYKNDILEFGVLHSENVPNMKETGRNSNVYLLNEEQTSLLIMYLSNTEKVKKFKIAINKQFHYMKKALLQVELNKQNKEWLESREKGKETRKKVAKEYENYLKYAIESGSKTYEKKPQLAYSQFTNMVNKSLFDFEFKPKAGTTRNYMTKDQLDIVNSAEILTQKIIQQEIDKGTEYHEIFKITKAKIKTYAELSGKSKIIDILVNNQIDMLNLLK
jgi:phage regulator Rha-like protein